MTTEPFVIERTFNAPVDKVWQAITDKNKMKDWYFDIEEFEPEPGFEFKFYGGSDAVQYTHLCKITAVIPGKLLSYRWKYEGMEGESFVTFELNDDNGKTKIKVTHAGIETFPSHPDFKRSSFEQGWNFIICKSLPEYLEKN